MKLRLIPTACLAFALSPFAAGAATVIAHGDQVAYLHPEAAARTGVTMLERRVIQQDPAFLCETVTYTDVAIYHPRAGCGAGVVKRLTRDGRSSDGTISDDGTTIAWRTTDPAGSPTRIFASTPDGASVQEIFSTAGIISDLELSPDADEIFFKVYGRNSPAQVEILRIRLAQAPAFDIVDSASQADDLGLWRRCANEFGICYYTKRVGSAHDLFVWNGTSAAALYPSTPEDERFVSIFTHGANEPFALFRSTSLTGADSLCVLATATGLCWPVLYNSNPAWRITSPVVARDGSWAIFVSNGDFDGDNADGSDEAFRIVPDDVNGPAFQVTSAPPPPSSAGQSFAGVDVSEGGELFTWSSVLVTAPVACSGGSFNEYTATVRSYRAAGPQTFLFTDIVSSIDAILDPVADPTTGCSVAAGVATCRVRVRCSAETPRRVLLHAGWSEASCIDVLENPVEVALGAGWGVLQTFTLTLPACHLPGQGSFVLDVVSPDEGQPDVARATRGF